MRTLRVCVVQPLGVEVETSLRIATHVKHLPHMASTDPRAGVLGPLRKFLDLPPIQIVDVSMDVKKEVARYLNYNFYNLTSVSVTDSQSYTEMRNLAKNQLGLDLMNSYLPMGSLCQGLDLLQIMRNLDGFVSQYSYNMNMQQFTEFKPSPTASTKHLNTLSIKSIMASIRQHGLGVIDTTVNFTYQFLSHHFHTFSQLLYDDFLQSRLAKDERWYAQHKNEAGVGNMYPYDRSLKLVKDMKRGGAVWCNVVLCVKSMLKCCYYDFFFPTITFAINFTSHHIRLNVM